MIRHIPTGVIFQNRKEAKQILGRKRYSDISVRKEWEFLNNSIDNNNNQ